MRWKKWFAYRFFFRILCSRLRKLMLDFIMLKSMQNFRSITFVRLLKKISSRKIKNIIFFLKVERGNLIKSSDCDDDKVFSDLQCNNFFSLQMRFLQTQNFMVYDFMMMLWGFAIEMLRENCTHWQSADRSPSIHTNSPSSACRCSVQPARDCRLACSSSERPDYGRAGPLRTD